MKKHIGLFVLTVVLVCSLSSSAFAQTLYSNGGPPPLSSNLDAFTINYGYVVADSFTLPAASTVSGAVFYTWVSSSADVPQTVQWTIAPLGAGSTPPAPSYPASGTTAAITAQLLGTNQYGYYIYKDTITIGAPELAGSYWLELQNAVVVTGDPVFWDQNNGPSWAYDSGIGLLNGDTSLTPTGGSESFLVYGPNGPSGVPEPATMLLLGLGLIGVAGVRRKFKN
ncbi:MAG: PEP-CTERM sorting domain-containing protein [Syntrophales bacterium]|jgi:hypothetical protein